jgi:penicillin V acylase-like amidase (Ntn superfamily)
MKKHHFAGLVFAVLVGLCAQSYGCTSVCLDKKGRLILGNNLDWFCGYGLVVVNKRNVTKRGFWYANTAGWKWTSRYGSITVNAEGREFPVRGMNEAGLAIVEMTLPQTQFPTPDSRPVLSTLQWIQYQLDNNATVGQVFASDSLIRIDPTDGPSHFLLCDATGAIACIEWLQGKMVWYTGSGLPIPALANSTYESCIANGDDPSGRFKKVADMLAAYDTAAAVDGVSYVFSILQNVANEYIWPFFTQWRVVYDVRAMRFYYMTKTNSQIRYVDFKDFDFSCQTPVEVLDINSADTGNVRSAFTSYTAAINSDIVTRTFADYNSDQYNTIIGKKFSADTINAVAAFPESTFCEVNTSAAQHTPQQQTRECRIFPGSASASIHIVLSKPGVRRIALSLFDTRGRMVASGGEYFTHPGQDRIVWRLAALARGVYHCKVVAGDVSYVRPIVIRQ